MMKTRLLTPQITAFHCQPENHHPCGDGHRSLKLRRQRFRLAMECGGGDGLKSKKKKEEDDDDDDGRTMENQQQEVEEESNWKQDDDDDDDDDVNEKVELMEREAIMGKDDGREAMDYKRRAAIFYKSSEMLMHPIIKDHDHPHH